MAGSHSTTLQNGLHCVFLLKSHSQAGWHAARDKTRGPHLFKEQGLGMREIGENPQTGLLALAGNREG